MADEGANIDDSVAILGSSEDLWIDGQQTELRFEPAARASARILTDIPGEIALVARQSTDEKQWYDYTYDAVDVGRLLIARDVTILFEKLLDLACHVNRTCCRSRRDGNPPLE